MPLTLIQEQAVSDLAKCLYDFLPGQAHPFADQSISIQGAANAVGLGNFWQGGSKQPATTALLRRTLEGRADRFCDLVTTIVRKSITYRRNKSTPLTRQDVRAVNEVVQRLGFKIPELWDPKFLDSLPSLEADKIISLLSDSNRKRLISELQRLSSLEPQRRGYAFEKFLTELFSLSSLTPKNSFRLVGEQIDGSFQHGHDTYLLEATWRNEQVDQEELLAFYGKVTGKAAWSRGLHISYAGFSRDGLTAFARGKPTAIICMDGLCIHDTLQHNLHLASVIERKARRAAETNDAFVPVRELFPEVR